MQAKLLRVLQERELERVGGNRTIKVDVRVIATTNRNLEQSVEKKEFRQDLFFRLNVVSRFTCRRLRERREDVPFLAEEFMRRFGRKHGVHVRGFSDDPLARCSKTITGPATSANCKTSSNAPSSCAGESGMLEPEHLGMAARTVHPALPPALRSPAQPRTIRRRMSTLAEMEKRHIFATLEQCKGNRTHAAKVLDVSIRTLRNKLHEYNATSSRDPEAQAEPVS